MDSRTRTACLNAYYKQIYTWCRNLEYNYYVTVTDFNICFSIAK